MKVTIADPLPGPLWWYPTRGAGVETVHWYHAALPAAMTGGWAASRLTAQTTGEAFALDLNDPAPFARLRDADAVTVFGLGSVTVVSLGVLLWRTEASEDAGVALDLLEGIAAAGGVVWLSAEDDLTDAYEHGRRCAAIRGTPPDPRVSWPALRWRCQMFPQVMAGVIASSQVIADRLRALAGAVPAVTIAEAVDPTLTGVRERQEGDPLRVGCAGGWQHLDDLRHLAWSGLVRAAAEPGVFLHLFGVHPGLFRPGGGRDGWFDAGGVRYRHHAHQPLTSYLRAIGLLDVTAVPLLPAPWNDARSPLKWQEGSLRGAAIVASASPAHAAIEHMRTGLIADTAEDFSEAIMTLVRDEGLRDRIARQARDEVLAHHTIAARAPAWRRWLAEATEGREHGEGGNEDAGDDLGAAAPVSAAGRS